MSSQRKIQNRAHRRERRVRSRLTVAPGTVRISVQRSLKYIYAQAINDDAHHTLASCSSHEFEHVRNKQESARLVGLELAKRAREQGVETIVFDRGQCLYHGRVKSLADGLREGGLRF